MDRRGGAQEGNGSARGWNARQHEAQSPPTPQNSDYQVRPVEVGARAPHNTPASPYGRAASGGTLTPSHSDILDNFEPSQLQQQGMNTSARLEFPTRARGPCSVAAPVDSRSSISSTGSQSSSQKKKKALCADCPGRRPRLHSAPKRIPPRKYNGRRVSQRTPPCTKLFPVSNAGNTPRYEYIVRPADLLENQKEMITEANAKFIRTPATPPPIVSPFKSPHGGIEYDGLDNDITAEEVRGLLMRVSARLLYAAIRRAQAEVGQMRGATPISEEERRRQHEEARRRQSEERRYQHEEARRRQSEERRYQRLGSPIPLDLDLDDSVFESPQKEELQRNKTPSARVTFASSGAQTDPQKNRSIPWNLIEPKNLVRGLFHEWKQQHPGWETGKYRLKVDPSETSVVSSRRQTSVTSVASSRRQRRQGQFGGPPNDPREATRALIRAFVKYQDEYINRHAGRNN